MKDLSITDRVVLVVGLARSGCAVGALLRRHGARVIGIDDASPAKIQDRWNADGLQSLSEAAFDEIHTDGNWPAVSNYDFAAVAVSPGVPLDHPELKRLRSRIPVLGEMEWASRFCRGKIVAITGTNGKSTTTELAAHLARAAGWQATALGNIGQPLSLEADHLGPEDLAVLEVSSFQLESIDEFRPHVSVVLNLAPDHLDRYASVGDYYRAKRRLVEATAAGGAYVTWTGCPEARGWAVAGAPLLFGERAQGADVYLEDGSIWLATQEERVPLLDVAQMPLQSAPYLLNATAAIAALQPLRPDRQALAEGLRTFRGLPHRQQPVARLGRVVFINDSKATNVAAVCAGLAGYASDVVLIAGGRGKGEDYRPLRQVAGSLRAAVVIGEEGPAIGRVLAEATPVHGANSLDEAVALAARLAAPAGVVLLSPACASFDMFRDFRDRGEVFAAAALKLGADEVDKHG